jgi:iron complex outermembrane receptor protein
MWTREILTEKKCVSVALFILLSISTYAFADKQASETKKDYFNMSLEELMEVEVTTGASRPMKKDEMPASITVITSDEIKLLGLRHLTDVINYMVPGGIADIHKSSGKGGLYNFRGISADDNGKFIFMIDGLNVTSMTSAGAMDEMYLGLLDELDRIEITEGPSSNLYGDGATSGVINFITKTGRDFQGTEIASGYGSGDRSESSLKYGSKKSDTENDFYYFGYKQSHGYVPSGGSGSETSGYGRKEHADSGEYWDHFEPSFKFHTNIERGDFTLRARYVREKYESPFVIRSTSVANISDLLANHSYLFIEPEIRHQFSEVSRMKANISFGMDERQDEKLEDWYASGNLIAKEGEKTLTRGERKFRSQILYYYDGFANHQLTTGIDMFWMRAGPDLTGQNYEIVSSGSPLYQRVKRSGITPETIYSGAFLFEDIWRLGERDMVFVGMRLENHNIAHTCFSPRATLSHDFDEKTNLKLIYDTGFRIPNWSYYEGNLSNNYPQPKPEKVQNYEVHLSRKLSPKLSTTLIGYYTIYKDLIFASGSNKYNFNTVEAEGLELVADYKTEGLGLKASHSYSRPVSFKDSADTWTITKLSYDEQDWGIFPTNMTKAHAIIELVKDKCFLGITYLRPWGIKGQRNADPKLKKPADFINATLTFKLNKNLDLQISGYNLTSEDHPWWGPYTYDGVSRDINPNPTYFVRLIGKF